MLIPLIRKSLVFTVAVPIQTFPVPVEPVYPEDGVVFLTSEAVPELEKSSKKELLSKPDNQVEIILAEVVDNNE